ncbi:MAG: TonB-dependent receptor [Methylococcaceae bacterium]|nr:TonB-dependent receptor [Methylococcaceae bacterium]
MKSFQLFLLFSLCSMSWAQTESAEVNNKDVTELDMAELLKVKVTSVSKKTQALSDAPSAIFVISNEDIKRTGVTSVPEALRMAPGIDVARINANRWAITARGFNGGFANKLLVLIDGRSVYTPSFSGVYWDAQDVMLEDVDRIEVIRGPGATLWGANAVNGVINIITKTSESTQGGLLTAGGGNLERGFGALRYGKKLTEDTYGRVYAKGFTRSDFNALDGGHTEDNWSRQQGGFRVDSRLSDQDELTFQGDLYQNQLNQSFLLPDFAPPFLNRADDNASVAGWNLTSRYKHILSSTSEYSLQFYYDHTERKEFTIGQALDILDIDFQNNFQITPHQNFIWGLGYRANFDSFNSTPFFQFDPSKRNVQLFSSFLQNEIMLIDDKLWLTIGSKFEHNDYTGFEGQPSAKLMWAPSSKQRVWASVSRAVRTPSRGENDIRLLEGIFTLPPPNNLTLPFTLNGNRQYNAEELLSFELGYRFTLANRASLDMTAFYSDYNNLRTSSPGTLQTAGNLPFFFTNEGRGKSYGFETSMVWQMTDWWRWDGTYSFFNAEFSQDALTQVINSISPKHKVSLRALLTPIDKVNLDFWFRYNSKAGAASARTLDVVPINEYVTLDARIGCQIHPAVELSVTGQNLLDSRHLEFIEETYILPTEIPRGVYGKIKFEF